MIIFYQVFCELSGINVVLPAHTVSGSLSLLSSNKVERLGGLKSPCESFYVAYRRKSFQM